MSLAIPQIVERLPQHREQILKARFRVEAVDELCRDYDTVSAALDTEASTDNRLELKRLAEDLEKEMLHWLQGHPEPETKERISVLKPRGRRGDV
jgi:hypothetical protein